MGRLTGYIVGAGYMGDTHLKCYRDYNAADIIGVVDLNKDKGLSLAEKYGLKWFPSLEDAFEYKSVDFCDICLPSFLHKDFVVKAIEFGAHVLCEKPFAISLSDIDEMIAASEKYSKRLLVAHVCRFMPQYYKAKEILESGSIGRPIIYECFRESETPMWSWNSWLFDKTKSGGTLLDLSIHDLDIANWLLGVPKRHKAELSGIKEKEFVNHTLSTIEYESGAVAHVTASHLLKKGHPFETSFKLIGTEGSIEFDSAVDPSVLNVYHTDSCESIALNELEGSDDSYGYEIREFTKALESGNSFRISPYEARLAVETVNNLYEASTLSLI